MNYEGEGQPQVRPDPTESNQIQPNPTKSNQIQPVEERLKAKVKVDVTQRFKAEGNAECGRQNAEWEKSAAPYEGWLAPRRAQAAADESPRPATKERGEG